VSGFGRNRFEWVEKPPLCWTILAVVYFIYGPLRLLDGLWLPHFAAPTPRVGHTYAISIDGRSAFVTRWFGGFHNKGGWILGVLLATLILIMIVRHDQVRKVP
jgi:hypothetical protein